MSKKCRHCNYVNDDSLLFCHACGEPLSKDLKFMMDLNQAVENPRSGSDQARRRKADDDDYDDYVAPRHTQQEKKSHTWLVVLVILAIIGVVVWFFMR